MTTENELPHELRGLIGQIGSASGGGPVPGLAPTPAPNALAYGTPGLATNALAPAEAPNLGDPNALARVIAQLAGEMFGGASVVPIPMPEDLFLVRGGAPMSPGVSPMAGTPAPTVGGVPTTPAISPALAPMSSSNGGASMPSLGGGSPLGGAPMPSLDGGSMPSGGGSPESAALRGPQLGGTSPAGMNASPFVPTSITAVPTWAPDGSAASASRGSNISGETHPASSSTPSASASTDPAPSTPRSRVTNTPTSVPMSGALATGDALSHGAPAGQLAQRAGGGTDASPPPTPHPHVDYSRVDDGRGLGGGTDASPPPTPHPHVDSFGGFAAPDQRATASSLSRATSAIAPGSSGAVPQDAATGATGVMPRGSIPGGSMPSGSMPGGSVPGFATSELGGLAVHEMRLPMVGDTAIDAAPWVEPALGLDTELVRLDLPHEAATPLGASAPARTSFGSSTPVRDLGRAPFDPYAVRRDFPILDERVHGKRLVWLDNAATTQKPVAVIDRLSEFYLHENSNIHRGAHTLAARATDAYEKARDTTRRFLNASSPSEIIFVRGATEGINLIAKSWGARNVGPGDEIVITHLEHHANIVPWQQLCAERGARLRVAPVDDRGDIILEAYERLLGPRTKLVALPQVSNAIGTITPAREMVDIAHRHGACVLVDGAQAVSHMRVDVQALDCDFYVFSGHKVFAPTGIGAVFGKREVLADMPPWQGGGNMIADVTFERTTYQDPPFRFEAGTGNIADAAGLGTALDYVMAIGMDVIDRYEHDLLVYATDRLARVPGLTMIGAPRAKAGVLSFVLDGQRTEDVGAMLDQDGIAVRSGHHCAQPILRRLGVEASVRASLAFYNVCEDIDALVESLLRIQSRPL